MKELTKTLKAIRKKQAFLEKSLFQMLCLSPICALAFCSSPHTSPIESMAQPIILTTKNDSLIEVEDKSGKKYALNTSDRISYSCALMHVGDTIKVVSAK